MASVVSASAASPRNADARACSNSGITTARTASKLSMSTIDTNSSPAQSKSTTSSARLVRMAAASCGILDCLPCRYDVSSRVTTAANRGSVAAAVARSASTAPTSTLSN